jgi:hypothetical protein
VRPLFRVLAPFALTLLVARGTLAEPARRATFGAPQPMTLPEPGIPPRPITEADVWMDYGRAMERIARAFAWMELAFPDLRVQTPANVGHVDALVLSWPAHVVGLTARQRRSAAGGTVFVEPAFPTDHWAARGLAGVRVWAAERSSGLGVVVEGGGLLATDGSGAFAGGGPAIGHSSGLLALVGRRYFVLGADRWDFTLELTMPMYSLVELVGG